MLLHSYPYRVQQTPKQTQIRKEKTVHLYTSQYPNHNIKMTPLKKNRKKITPPLTKKKKKKNNERHPYVAVNECWMMPESLIHSTEGEGVACTGQKSSTSSPATAFTSPTTDSVKRGGTGWRRCKTNNK